MAEAGSITNLPAECPHCGQSIFPTEGDLPENSQDSWHAHSWPAHKERARGRSLRGWDGVRRVLSVRPVAAAQKAEQVVDVEGLAQHLALRGLPARHQR